MKKQIAAALLSASVLSTGFVGVAEAGPRWERLRAVAGPIKERLKTGEPLSVDIAVGVQIGGDGQPIEIEQDSDINIARVVQFGGGAQTRIDQIGLFNFGRVTQRDCRRCNR